MTQTTDILRFIHDTRWGDLPEPVQKQAGLCLLDLTGVGIGGATTPLSAIIRDHAATEFGGRVPMMFDDRTASASGAALAAGMTIDALDGHDGYNPAKGHVGCGVLAGIMALAGEAGLSDGREFLATLAVGYEVGSRLSVSLHGTVPDYHTSGAWVAVAVAALGSRMLKLDAETTRHAMGIAEYHGPRSQMMRCIDHPTMVKDGSGWGAMAGVSAVLLARGGFTGAPAITVEHEDTAPYWADLGQRWLILEQYYKPYPVCRWAQAPMEGVLKLRREHGIVAGDVERIEVRTFHASCRLATNDPKTTEEAQYSTSYPVAVAMVRGDVAPEDISPEALHDPEIRRLSLSLSMTEDAEANRVFPGTRMATVTVRLRDGRTLESGWMKPRWDAEAPPTEAELRAKFHSLAKPLLGPVAASRVEAAVAGLAGSGSLSAYVEAVCRPVRHPKVRAA